VDNQKSVDPTRCPLCGESNNCGAARGEKTCWCFDLKIPVYVLENVPENARGKACVCQRCILAGQAAGKK